MHELIEQRWSARLYDRSATIDDAHLREILDAGRWAPTWGGVQPVRFVVGRRGDATFTGLVEVLSRGNSAWAPHSSALILVCSRQVAGDENATTYGAVDAGLAVAQMILQAVADGYNAHPMAGFDKQSAIERFHIPAEQRPLVLLAVGTLADPATADPQIAARDRTERSRLPLPEMAFADSWGQSFSG